MLYLYNTLTRQKELFTSLMEGEVKMYTCGPTVYDYQHIGHMRRYVGDDILVRILSYNGYRVNQVMNITDVGHLVSDADEGEDKMEKGARKFAMSVWDIAKKFEKQFLDSEKILHITSPRLIMHATDYIPEQIDFIRSLEAKGFTYKTHDGIYFDTSKFPDYNKLSRQKLTGLKQGARVTRQSDKTHATDFALWKFSSEDEKRQMEWDSPWGKGFPGWHIECSAMATTALGETLDIHTGGIDHIAIHHTNEIAQSESVTGKPFVRYWVHHDFLMVEGEKMSKSLGNIFTVSDIEKKGYDPLALRYLYFQTHYRQEMNFTWDALQAAQQALHRLYSHVREWPVGEEGIPSFEEAFAESINDDMNMPKALGIVWELVKSKYPAANKGYVFAKMNKIFGFTPYQNIPSEDISERVRNMVNKRELLRGEGKFEEADLLRKQVEKEGFCIEDKEGKSIVKKILSEV